MALHDYTFQIPTDANYTAKGNKVKGVCKERRMLRGEVDYRDALHLKLYVNLCFVSDFPC